MKTREDHCDENNYLVRFLSLKSKFVVFRFAVFPTIFQAYMYDSLINKIIIKKVSNNILSVKFSLH